MNTRDVQAALLALGYDLGKTGPQKDGVDGDWGTTSKTACAIFQRGRGLAATGELTPETIKALLAAVAAKKDGAGQPGAGAQLPADWLPPARISRVIVHWSAGNHRASQLDRSHYHILIESDAKLIRGIPSIAMNDAGGVSPGYAAHTLNCNTGSIGVSLCCMAGASESPFKPGSAPMTREQWEALPAVLADLCRRYSIPVTPKTVLSHAEVQGTLGIKQKGKWDISRLAFDPIVVGAGTCGSLMRAAVARLL